jgi:hypothetical protein
MSTSTIPFDPSLVLGMIVDPKKIEQLKKIAELQLPVDLCRDKVNALLRQKLSLDMTMQELITLGAGEEDLADFKTSIADIMTAVITAAKELGTAVIAAEKEIAATKLEQGQNQIGSAVESPLDFGTSQLKSMPISSDTMNMDVQYFRYEENEEESKTTSTKIAAFVGKQVSNFLTGGYGIKAAVATKKQLDEMQKNRQLIGTVVIVANCTHKTAKMFSPVQLNVDEAVDNYKAYSGQAWGSNPLSRTAMTEIAMDANDGEDGKSGIPLLVGATYGSSFVGFVHFEQIETTESSTSAYSAAVSVAAKIKKGMFLASQEGSFGLDAESAKSAEELLSTSNVQSHCSVITMGLIPSIKSNNVKTAVEVLKSSPQERMQQLDAMQGSTNAAITSVSASAENARKSQAMEKMKSDDVKGSVGAVADVDTQSNKVIDMNSMMTALDDFVSLARSADGGVPINFYIKYITKRIIAQQWLAKYYPELLEGKRPKEDK